MKILSIAMILICIKSAYANLDSYKSQFKVCKHKHLSTLLINSSQAVSEKMEPLNQEQRESYFYKNTFESQLITFLGSRYLSDDTNLSITAKSCGSYIDMYINSLMKNRPDDDKIVSWMLCIESSYREQIPELAQQIMDCYRSKN